MGCRFDSGLKTPNGKTRLSVQRKWRKPESLRRNSGRSTVPSQGSSMSTRTVACKPSLPARQTVDEASSSCAANRYRLLLKKAVMPHDSEAASAVSSGYARTGQAWPPTDNATKGAVRAAVISSCSISGCSSAGSESSPWKRDAVGSNPTTQTSFWQVGHPVGQFTVNEPYVGSSPTLPARFDGERQ